MGIALNTKFAANLNKSRNQSTSQDDRPKAQFWMNIGYLTPIMNTETNELEDQFVGLPMGIPLDTQERRPVNRGTPMFLARNTAQNALLDDILEACKDMKPGENKYFDFGENAELKIQVYRVKPEAEAIDPNENPFRRKMAFA